MIGSIDFSHDLIGRVNFTFYFIVASILKLKNVRQKDDAENDRRSGGAAI